MEEHDGSIPVQRLLHNQMEGLSDMHIWTSRALSVSSQSGVRCYGVGGFVEDSVWQRPRQIWWTQWRMKMMKAERWDAPELNNHLGGGFNFQIFFIFIPIWGRFPFWLIFLRWVGSTTNQSWTDWTDSIFTYFYASTFTKLQLSSCLDSPRHVTCRACTTQEDQLDPLAGWPKLK